MIYKIFDYDSDLYLVDSFLESSAISHNLPKQSIEWFKWKFESSPFGKSILACAIDNNRIIGCVALGLGEIRKDSKIIKLALSYENFVHPDYQRKGIFKELIMLVENEASMQSVDILYNFPNNNSLPGFRKLGWVSGDKPKYKLFVLSPLRLLANVNNVKVKFQPCNLSPEYSGDFIDEKSFFYNMSVSENLFESYWSPEYYNWRFSRLVQNQYLYIKANNCRMIIRVGYRGCLKEAQILKVTNPSYLDLIKLKYILKNNYSVDLVSIYLSKNDRLNKYFKSFISVPSSLNFTYKILNNNLSDYMSKFCICGIDFHTY